MSASWTRCQGPNPPRWRSKETRTAARAWPRQWTGSWVAGRARWKVLVRSSEPASRLAFVAGGEALRAAAPAGTAKRAASATSRAIRWRGRATGLLPAAPRRVSAQVSGVARPRRVIERMGSGNFTCGSEKSRNHVGDAGGSAWHARLGPGFPAPRPRAGPDRLDAVPDPPSPKPRLPVLLALRALPPPRHRPHRRRGADRGAPLPVPGGKLVRVHDAVARGDAERHRLLRASDPRRRGGRRRPARGRPPGAALVAGLRARLPRLHAPPLAPAREAAEGPGRHRLAASAAIARCPRVPVPGSAACGARRTR